jgi:hypothetical protein
VATIEARAGEGALPAPDGAPAVRNLGNGRFEDAGSRGRVFKVADVGRGCSGDIDNDGDTDVVIGNAAADCGCS